MHSSTRVYNRSNNYVFFQLENFALMHQLCNSIDFIKLSKYEYLYIANIADLVKIEIAT